MPFFMTNKGLQLMSSSDAGALDKVDPSTRLPMGYDNHTVQLGCFLGKGSALTDDDSDAEEMRNKCSDNSATRGGSFMGANQLYQIESGTQHRTTQAQERNVCGESRAKGLHRPAAGPLTF